jgi:hypothetical protein
LAYLHICKYNIYIYAYNRESWSRTAFAKTWDPIWKITKAQKVWWHGSSGRAPA